MNLSLKFINTPKKQKIYFLSADFGAPALDNLDLN